MSEKLTKEQLAALERFKRTKDDPETFAGFFYGMLQQADPRLVEHMEQKAAIVMHAGYSIGAELARADLDPAKKAELERKFQQIAIKINSSIYKPDTKDDVEE